MAAKAAEQVDGAGVVRVAVDANPRPVAVAPALIDAEALLR
jgi:hypothetical protein